MARRRVAEAIADRSFDARQFMTLPAGEPVDGVLEVALIATGRTVGEWPDCLSHLKQTALKDESADLRQRLAIGDGSMQDRLDEDERQRQADRESGRVVQLAGVNDELLHYFANLNMVYRTERIHREMTGQLYGGRPAPDPGDDDIQMITLRETLKPLCSSGQVE